MLFDSGVSHSFVSARVIDQLCRFSGELNRGFHVLFPSSDKVVSWRKIQALPVLVKGRELHIDLMELEMDDFKLILSMDM